MKTEELTEEQKRVKIAEVCGWKRGPLDDPLRRDHLWQRPDGTVSHACAYPIFPPDFPDYFHDLNAIYDAVASIPVWQQSEWTRAVRIIVLRDNEESDALTQPDTGRLSDAAFYNSTAAQRAEAFGLAMGLWK